MFLRHLLPVIPLLLAVCSAGAQQTSISNGTASAAKVNPYAQPQPSHYTSVDNPYAPGGLYDYRLKKPGTLPASGTGPLDNSKTKNNKLPTRLGLNRKQSGSSGSPIGSSTSMFDQTNSRNCSTAAGGFPGSHGGIGSSPSIFGSSSRKSGCSGSGSTGMSDSSPGSASRISDQTAAGINRLDQAPSQQPRQTQSIQKQTH